MNHWQKRTMYNEIEAPKLLKTTPAVTHRNRAAAIASSVRSSLSKSARNLFIDRFSARTGTLERWLPHDTHRSITRCANSVAKYATHIPNRMAES